MTKRVEDFLKKHAIEIYYVLCFILICFVLYGIYSCVKLYGCDTVNQVLSSNV